MMWSSLVHGSDFGGGPGAFPGVHRSVYRDCQVVTRRNRIAQFGYCGLSKP